MSDLRLRLLQILLHTDDPHQEALLGDLLEERAGGRSWFWFWRAVLHGAVLVTIRDVRAHGFLTVRAMASAWMIAEGSSRLASLLLYGHLALPASAFRFHVVPLAPITITILLFSTTLSSWHVARLNRGREGTVLVFYLAIAMFIAVGAMMWGPLGSGHINALELALGVVLRFCVLPAAIVAGSLLSDRPRPKGRIA